MATCDLANPRALARRARLLGPRGAAALAGRTESEALAGLEAAPWGGAWRRAVDHGEDPFAAADAVLATAAAAAAREVERLLAGRALAAFRAALLLDAAAELKAVLRGVAAGEPADRATARALPLPGLSEAALRAVAAAPLDRAPEALAATGSPLAEPLRAAVAATGAEPGLLHFEAALDRAAAALAVQAAAGRGPDATVARRAIARRADHANAALLLALGAAPLAAEWLVPGGAVSAGAWLRAGASPADDRPEAVARALGGRRGPPSAEELVDPARAEAALAALRDRAIAREARAEPLTVAVPLAWVAAARAEARHVRLALRGAAFGLAPGDLLDLLEG
jgi:V/A-type H+-transporting ATPase subunit C